MKFQLQLVIKSEDGEVQRIDDVAELIRDDLSIQTLGLTLTESKSILEKIQRIMAVGQAESYLNKERHCTTCSAARHLKGRHDIVVRTVFGKLTLESPRWYSCQCEVGARRSFSPLAELLPERTTLELFYLETKCASLMSYGLSVNILSEFLPIGEDLKPTTIRRHQQLAAERMEKELGEEQSSFVEGCPLEWANLSRPEPSLVVGIDGGYIHARDEHNRKAGCFEVIAGKSGSEERDAKCFGFVNNYDQKPRRRIFEVLRSQGMQHNQTVTFVSDGGDTVRDLQFYLNPESEHILDWFHVTMRLTVIKQMIKGLNDNEELLNKLERVKWFLWHGNTDRACESIDDLNDEIQARNAESGSPKPLLKAIKEFRSYIQSNVKFIPNYGDRYRHGEVITTSFVESTVNQVISRRFVKKQRMRWTRRGAHLLLQTRTKTLNGDLTDKFREWYPAKSEMASA